MRIRTFLTDVTKMILGVMPSASSGQALRRSRRIWPANDEILRGACPWAQRRAQNDSFAVGFGNLNIGILRHCSGQVLNLFPPQGVLRKETLGLRRISDLVLRILTEKHDFAVPSSALGINNVW